MKKLILLILIIILTCITLSNKASSQVLDWNPVSNTNLSFSVSPFSVKLFGKAPSTMKVSAQYGIFKVEFLHTFKKAYLPMGVGWRHGHPYRKVETYSGSWFGVFAMPIQANLDNIHIQAGAGWLFRKFPFDIGQHLHFMAEVSYMFADHLGIKFSHESNGFGILNPINVGLDNISLKIKL